MEKVHIIFDADKCVGCYNCLLACQDEFCGNEWMPYTHSKELHGEKWIKTTRYERGHAPITEVAFLTQMCYQCKNAECEKAFPDQVIRRDDGIVLIHPEKSRGNRELVSACPYGMIKWNEELGAPQKCTMCAHLLDDGWKEPRCVQACPLRALSFVRCSDEEFDKLQRSKGLKSLAKPEAGARVVYKNLYKINSVYVYGAVAHIDGGIEHAVEGAEVRLLLNGEEIVKTTTDFFGEYKLDCLPKNAGNFEVEINKDGFKPVVIPVTVGNECENAGVAHLE